MSHHSDANIILNTTDDEDSWSGASGSGDGTDDGDSGAGFTPTLNHPSTHHPGVSTNDAQGEVSDPEENFLPIACGVTVAAIIIIFVIIFLIILIRRGRNKKKARVHREYQSQNTEMTIRAMNNRPLQAAPTVANGSSTSAKSAASAKASTGAKADSSAKYGAGGSNKGDKDKGRKDSSSSLPSTSAPPPPYSSVVEPSGSSTRGMSAAAAAKEKQMSADGDTYLSVPKNYDNMQNSENSSLHGYEVTGAENPYEVV